MTDTTANWVSATPADSSAVLGLMRAFYAEELLVLEADRTAQAVHALLGSPELGAIFLLKQADELRGYFIVTLAFSVEFGGRFALLDELYISPPSRGTGQSKHALTTAESWTRHHQIPTLRLEVNHHNDKALNLYLKAGFKDEQRRVLTKWVEG